VLLSCGVVCNAVCVSMVDAVIVYDTKHWNFKVEEYVVHLFGFFKLIVNIFQVNFV
jgi:hypothetical protein